MKLTTLSVLKKLDDAHRTDTRSLQDREKQDGIRDVQLSQLSSNLEELKEMVQRSAAEDRILQSLQYQRMESREEKITDAHAQTFEWIFDSHVFESRLPSKDNFVEWLTSGNGIFWVTGKAGSGKSTLMKYLSHHKSATSALQQWADEKELITAAFYFWHAGTELQKSQEGLFQSLLHGILSQCPEIMPQVLSERWEQCTRTQSSPCRWTRAELLNAFAKLSHQYTLKKRFFFFIDGLDEYDGDHSELVDLVQGFVRSGDIKICLSSRPWNVFTRAFGMGSHPKFHLEDLTQRDIQSYVQDTLGGNRLFCQLAAGKDSARCKKLGEEIVSRAQGVFLWVFLVVRSLMDGLTNADRITDLERRLQSLPTDLEAYFRHMLKNIEKVYVQQTVQTFQIALQAAQPLNLMTYAMIDELEEDPRFAIELPVQQMTTAQVESRCQDMKLRINARCKDLLQITKKEIYKVHNANSVNAIEFPRPESSQLEKLSGLSDTLALEPDLQSDDFPAFVESAPLADASAHQNTQPTKVFNDEPTLHPFFQYEVDFLHRTVKDFFQVNDIQRFIADRIPETFNYCALLCHAFFAQIKVAPIKMHHFNQSGELSGLIDDLAHYAHQVEKQTGHSCVELLDELPDVIRVHREFLQVRGSDGSVMECPVKDPSMKRLCQSFLGFAVQRDLQLYVTHKLDERLRSDSPTWEDYELVLDALEPWITSKYGVRSMNRTMLRILVDRGVNLNRPLLTHSIWDHVIGRIYPEWDPSFDTRIHDLKMVIALLEVGAEPNWSPSPIRLLWVQFILVPPENWRTGSIEFEAALTRTIVAFCERGIDPYWEVEGDTLWCLFIRSIYHESGNPSPFSLETSRSILVIIKKFISLGAQLDDVVYHDINKCEDGNLVGLESLTVTDVLTRIFSKKDLEELRSLEMEKKADRDNPKSKTKPSGAQRRRKKKRRKERRKILAH